MENFGELMNTNMAPNVSIQRNQSLPGPMSPRFQQGVQGQAAPPGSPLPTQQNLSPMLRAGAAQQRMAQQLGGATTQPQWRPRTNPAMMNGGTMAQVRIGLSRSKIDSRLCCLFVCYGFFRLKISGLLVGTILVLKLI